MSDRMLKVKACEHTSRTLVFSSGEDAPGKSLDTCEQCNTCGAVIHDYRHGGGLRSPNYPIVRESPLLKPFLAVCQQLIEAERALAGRGMSLTPDLDMIRLAKENERLRLDLDVAESRKSDVIRRLVEDGDRMRLVLHDLAFAAPHVLDEHRDQRGWLGPAAWGKYVARVQKMAGGAIRRPPTDLVASEAPPLRPIRDEEPET